MSQRRFFGTDGIRGVAGTAPMTAAFALALGSATAEHLWARLGERPSWSSAATRADPDRCWSPPSPPASPPAAPT
jgi:hypothetical protein